MLSTQTKGWVGPGARNICQQRQRAKKQVTNNTEHVTQKNSPLYPGPSNVRKRFPLILFLSQLNPCQSQLQRDFDTNAKEIVFFDDVSFLV